MMHAWIWEREREWRGRIYAMQVVIRIQLIAIVVCAMYLTTWDYLTPRANLTPISTTWFISNTRVILLYWTTLFFFPISHNFIASRVPPPKFNQSQNKNQIKFHVYNSFHSSIKYIILNFMTSLYSTFF